MATMTMTKTTPRRAVTWDIPPEFEAWVGVEEVWVIHRDTKVPEVFVRGVRKFRKVKARRGGWLVSDLTGIELRPVAKAKLALRLRDDHGTEAELPEDA